MRQYVDRYQ